MPGVALPAEPSVTMQYVTAIWRSVQVADRSGHPEVDIVRMSGNHENSRRIRRFAHGTSRFRITTGITRVVFSWYSAKPG